MFAELEEECCQTADCVLEGVTFYVAYLGSCLVDTPSGEETTSQAVRTIVAMVSPRPNVSLVLNWSNTLKNGFKWSNLNNWNDFGYSYMYNQSRIKPSIPNIQSIKANFIYKFSLFLRELLSASLGIIKFLKTNSIF